MEYEHTLWGWCRLTQFLAERGLNVSVAKFGAFMGQYLKQGPSLFRGFFVWKSDGYSLCNLSYFMGDHCIGKSSDRWQKEPFDSISRRFDAYHRPNLALCLDFEQGIDGFLRFPKKASLCVKFRFGQVYVSGKSLLTHPFKLNKVADL